MNPHSSSIPSREDILAILRTKGKIKIKSLVSALAVTPEQLSGLERRLAVMERDGQIEVDKNGSYDLLPSDSFICGRVISHRDGYGFVSPDLVSEDIYLPEREMQKVLHGDRVQVGVVGKDKRGRTEGKILEVLERASTHVLARLKHKNGEWIATPEDQRFGREIRLLDIPKGLKAGQIVNIEIIEQPARYTVAGGKIVEIVGDMDDPGIEIEIAVRKFDVPHQFSKAAEKRTAAFPTEVQDSDREGRVDLRDIPFVTIDGEDARDFDDAVYCEPVKFRRKNAFRLLVAIADVSHYVQPNDALDVDALERSTSVYFPRRVIPMLPEKLSNGLCSLNPAVERLTLVCDAVISTEGEILAYQFYPAVIYSAARLTYSEVAGILAEQLNHHSTDNPATEQTTAQLVEVVPHLLNLYAVYSALLQARQVRGAIDFETVETSIVSNAAGKIEKIVPRIRNEAHKLIEECMLAANVCAANFLQHHKQPVLYRIHAAPTKEKIAPLRTFLKQTGLQMGGGDTPTSTDYAQLMLKISARPDAVLLQTMLLRSMQQAVYSPDNIGHFGLSYPAYTHFTSPIRRYPDLLTHRAIKAVLAGKRYEPKGIDQESLNAWSPVMARKQEQSKTENNENNQNNGKKEKIPAIWAALGAHCSVNERRADEATRDVEAYLKCYFIKDKLGETFTGVISAVTTFGIFVQLDALFIEGLVHITELGSDYFQFDEVRHELKGERSGVRYRLTDPVAVQVSRVDVEARKIDLLLVDVINQQGSKNAASQNSSPKNGRRATFSKNKESANPGNLATKKLAKKTSAKGSVKSIQAVSAQSEDKNKPAKRLQSKIEKPEKADKKRSRFSKKIKK